MAYLQLERYYEAYDDAKSSLEMNGNKEKSLYRMGKAAYGMRDWEKALENYNKCYELFPNNNEVKIEIERAQARLKEFKTGNYDLTSLYIQAISTSTYKLDASDYTGPIEIIDIEGKGKGVVASRDLVKGTLLLVSKAFSFSIRNMTDENNNSNKSVIMSINLITKRADGDMTQGLNLVETVQTLKCNPQRAKELYSLYAGDLDRSENIDMNIIDIERIEKICSFNSFEGTQVHEALMCEKNSKINSTGLWILPSFINHSCLANTFRVFYGDVMMIYAVEDLKKGTEITCSYLDPFANYKARLKVMESFHFVCNCDLCVLDRSDIFYDRRIEIFNKGYVELRIIMLNANPHTIMKAFDMGKVFVDNLRNTYKKRNKYQLELFRAISLLANIYQVIGDFKKAASLLNEATEICNNSLSYMGMHAQIKEAECYKQCNNLKLAKKTLKKAFELNRIKTGADVKLFKLMFSETLKQGNIQDLI